MSDLLRALGIEDIDSGMVAAIVAAIGAGGKKSLLYAIAAAAEGRVAWTATVHTPKPPAWTGIETEVAPVASLLERAAQPSAARVRAFLQPSAKTGRVAGIEADDVERLHAAGDFDLTLVKADGARMRGIKAPRPREPVLPATTARVLAVVSAAVLGRPLDERVAHRPDRIAALTGLESGGKIAPVHFGRLFAAGEGALRGTGRKPVTVVINQVDDDERRAAAHDAARAILDAVPGLDRVVLTRLDRPLEPDRTVVEIVARGVQ